MLRSKVCKNAYQIISTFNGEYGKHVFEASGALRGPQEAFRGPQGVKIPLRSKVCKNAYQIISTFNGEYGKHNFEASGALRGPSGVLRGPSGGRSKNCRRHFKPILCCFRSIISPHTKFPPNPMKNAEVENCHYWSGLVGQAGR